ncbi:MAG: hypothetical protein M1825_004912 [Sarcosagium campestre]|nr:MAG: hypothetical protein M1825_004912 [Sarcosagium campestre]
MAARDRFSGPGDRSQSTLMRYIRSACDPSNYEPNLALDLEIADLINAKKGNAPREAAVAIVRYINSPNPNIALLALHLLDICVKNCGYPFHLQISTKEFLNELVRKFPERPRPHSSRVQQKILEALEEWRQTICQTSRYKEDLGFIRDMHRLLRDKGYMFPEIRKEDAAVLNPSDNLKSADEMEEEERAAQSAKLQELIRRGGPEDLQQANKLMKVMAGYDTKHKTDYRAKAAEEVGKIQQKAKILEEMLQGYKQGDLVSEGDVFEELASALQNAQPKIQKMCEEESDDQEAVAKLFEINDSIHRTIERYRLIKKGDLAGASKIPKGTLGTSTGVGKTADNELSLIDFGGDNDTSASVGSTGAAAAAGSSASQASGKGDSLEDDLLGLSFEDGTYGQGGGIALAFGSSDPAKQTGTPPPAAAAPQILSRLPGFPPPSSSPAATPRQNTPSRPNYSAFSNPASSQTPPTSIAATSSTFQPPTAPIQPPSDPFASITLASSRQPSPFQTALPLSAQTTSASASASLASLSQPGPLSSTQRNGLAGAAPASSSSSSSAAPTADADEWTFASALPRAPSPQRNGLGAASAQALPEKNTLTLASTTVRINLNVVRQPAPGTSIYLHFAFSNITEAAVSELMFQIAVPKGVTLSMQPQSGRTIDAHTTNGITQEILLGGVQRGKGADVKLRWKLSYQLAGSGSREERGEVAGLGIV